MKIWALALTFHYLPLNAENTSLPDDKLSRQAEQGQKQLIDKAQQNQKRIDQLDDQTADMLNKYRVNSDQIESYKDYIEALKLQIEDQKSEVQNLKAKIIEVEQTGQEIVPMTRKMLSSLKDFVSLDQPFLLEERQSRVKNLENIMSRSDVSIGEKFRKVLEAYQIEIEYGKTIEVSQERLNLSQLKNDSSSLLVDVLRIGRLAIFIRALDGSLYGYWSLKDSQWKSLPDGYQSFVDESLSMAKQESVPRMIEVPIQTALFKENAQEEKQAL